MPKNIMIVVGEASGDILGADLVKELKHLSPNICCYGLGGEKMLQTGFDAKVNAAELSVAGLVEIIKHYPRLRGILNRMKSLLKDMPPDLLILIDSPDFNLPLAKEAKRLGIKVLYYVSPQIWAWRKSRIKIIKKCIDMMAVVFPFEVKFYTDAGIKAKYVGHPLIKQAKVSTNRKEFFTQEKLNPEKKLIGLFPGSRRSEIENNFPTLLLAAEKLSKNRQDIQFITPIASTLAKEFIHSFSNKTDVNIHTTKADIYNTINACDAIAAASGTVTLQIVLMQTPMLLMYKISPFSYHILKRIVNFTYAGIANVIANKEIYREFIQHDANAINISNELNKLLSDQAYINNMKREMRQIKASLGEENGSIATAKLALELIDQ